MTNPFQNRAAEQMGGIEVIECESLEFVSHDEEEYNWRLSNAIARGRMVMMTDADRKIILEGTWRRAGGGVICEICKKEYNDHPIVHKYAILTKVCDGRLVKL